MTPDSTTKFSAKIDKKIFLKSVTSRRRLQESDGQSIEYCSARVKGLEESIDYKVTNQSNFSFNFLECSADFEFFRSFRDKEVEFSLNPSLYSGNNAIIDENNNPVYVQNGIYKITKYQRYGLPFNKRSNSESKKVGSILCTLCILLYALFVAICVIYILLKRDNYLKWLFLSVTHYIHIVAFFISLDFELPINLRVFLLCFYEHLIKWLGSLR